LVFVDLAVNLERQVQEVSKDLKDHQVPEEESELKVLKVPLVPKGCKDLLEWKVAMVLLDLLDLRE
jgi:hypothetical protein